jgi:hypothetical protein
VKDLFRKYFSWKLSPNGSTESVAWDLGRCINGKNTQQITTIMSFVAVAGQNLYKINLGVVGS